MSQLYGGVRISFRKARLEHLQQIKHLERVYFKEEAFEHSYLNYLLRSPRSTNFVALLDTRVIGYILGFRPSSNPSLGRIYSLCVQKEYRGKNIARRLLYRLKKDFLGRGIKRLSLEVKESNVTAIEFYRKQGFKKTRLLRRYYIDGSSAIKMEKLIWRLTAIHR